MSRRALALAALLLVSVGLARADRETAKFLEERADKALAAKQFAEAEGLYRKALGEDPTYDPARLGLAESLLGLEKRDEAVAEFRKVAADVKAMGDKAPQGWTLVRSKAERRLEQLDAAGTELRALVDGHVSALLAVARKYAKPDPETAIKACRRALVARPDDPKVSELMTSLGASPKGEPVALFDGETLDGWADVGSSWQVVDGAICGTIKDGAMAARTEKWFEGDFDVRVEMKLAEDFPGPSLFALQPCSDGKEAHYTFGWFDGRVRLHENFGPKVDERIAYDQPPPGECGWKKDDWNTYEIQFRKAEVRILVNGHQIFAETRPSTMAGGFLGLSVQSAKALFRKIEYVPR